MSVWWTNLNVVPIIQGVGNICFDDFLRFYLEFIETLKIKLEFKE